jgi:hypothetical protein
MGMIKSVLLSLTRLPRFMSLSDSCHQKNPETRILNQSEKSCPETNTQLRAGSYSELQYIYGPYGKLLLGLLVLIIKGIEIFRFFALLLRNLFIIGDHRQ